MGFKEQKELNNGLIAPDAYGRFESVSGKKDGPITGSFVWWANQEKATDREPSILEDTVTITPQEIADNSDLKTAYDAFVTEIYKHSKAVQYPNATDVI
jgi:hypothetical protein